MKTETPSRRWLKRWQRAHAEAHGWAGSATITALRPMAIALYAAGATPAAAGLATADHYRERAAYNLEHELADGRGADLAAARIACVAADKKASERLAESYGL